MADEVLDAEAIEEPINAAASDDAAVRPLPERRSSAELDPWRGEVRTVAMAAAGGIAAGAATVAVVNAVRARVPARRSRRGVLRRGRKRDSIVASRSFLIDVHVLGR
jgi:hypothetical protein